MRRGQKYVVRCHKGVARADVALGCSGRIRKGDLVTFEGTATRSPDRAFIYVAGEEDFPWDDGFSWGKMEEFFEAVPVKIILDE